MSQSLKALINIGASGWDIGQGRSDLFIGNWSSSSPQVLDYKGMKILFRPESGQAFTLKASEYPEAFSYLNSIFGNSTYVVLPSSRAVDSNGTTVITVGDNSTISRSVTNINANQWNAPSYPFFAATFRAIKYIPSWNKWIIPYSTNKCLISTDGTGTAFTDTVVTGLDINLNTYTGLIRLKYIGNILVLCTDTATYATTNGTAWTKVLLTAGVARKLTIGNGYFVVLHEGADSYSVVAKYSSDGYNWNVFTGFGVTHTWTGAVNYGYGLVFDGKRWVYGGSWTVSYQDGVQGSHLSQSIQLHFSTSAIPGVGSWANVTNGQWVNSTIYGGTGTSHEGFFIGPNTFSYENNGGNSPAAISSFDNYRAYTDPSAVHDYIIANQSFPTSNPLASNIIKDAFSTLWWSNTPETSGITSSGYIYKDLGTVASKIYLTENASEVFVPSTNYALANNIVDQSSPTIVKHLKYSYLYIRLA